MRALCATGMLLAMIRPTTSSKVMLLAMVRPIASSKVMLLADRRVTSHEPSAAPVRRYRLARLRFDGRSADPKRRFEHVKRVYD